MIAFELSSQFTMAQEINAVPPAVYDIETLALEKCPECPDTTCIKENEALCKPTCNEEAINQLEISLSDSRNASECENDLEKVIADTNRTIQLMEREYRNVLNETYTKLDLLEAKLGKQERQLQTTDERLHESRKKLSEADAELRKMHAAAMRQYVNTTLMREDAWNGMEKMLTKACRRVERRWGHYFRGMRLSIQKKRQIWNRRRVKTRLNLHPHIVLIKRNVQNRWEKSTLVRPLLDRLVEMGKVAAFEMYRPLKPTITEVEIACRLSIVSAIEEFAKTLLNFLEKDERLKLEKGHARKKRRDPMQRHLEFKRRNRRHEFQNHEEFFWEDLAKPSPLKLKAREYVKYALENSNQVYAEFVSLAPLVLALYLSRCGIVGSLFWLMGIPCPVIWSVAGCRLIKMRKKTQWDAMCCIRMLCCYSFVVVVSYYFIPH